MNSKDNLNKARKTKNDEFYTMYQDIEDEMQGYIKHKPEVFKDKTILLPCDEEWSNFTKYFTNNFDNLGLKKLIISSEDFRSEEVKALRNEADIIITNPPFSLFRGFLAWITEANKKFIIVGNMNAITYKEVFPLIRNDEMWLGFSKSGKKCFEVPDAGVKNAVTLDDGKVVVGLGNTAWFTNIKHSRRNQPLKLLTMADNIKHSKHAVVRENGYKKYDNYNAIEVPFTDAIPSDHKGVMGVPISFLDRYCPEQFEILGNSNVQGQREHLMNNTKSATDCTYINGTAQYARIFIKHRGE